MLMAFTFRAKRGKESEFERVLNNPEGGKVVARGLGATRNALFLKDGQMIRIMEFPDGARPKSMVEVAEADANLKAFLRRLGPLVEDGFDVDVPGSLEAFNRRISFAPAYDVHVGPGA
ncbi:MAG TPA: hypothetical protein VF992_04130 [Thermoplasmata archaeon]